MFGEQVVKKVGELSAHFIEGQKQSLKRIRCKEEDAAFEEQASGGSTRLYKKARRTKYEGQLDLLKQKLQAIDEESDSGDEHRLYGVNTNSKFVKVVKEAVRDLYDYLRDPLIFVDLCDIKMMVVCKYCELLNDRTGAFLYILHCIYGGFETP